MVNENKWVAWVAVIALIIAVVALAVLINSNMTGNSVFGNPIYPGLKCESFSYNQYDNGTIGYEFCNQQGYRALCLINRGVMTYAYTSLDTGITTPFGCEGMNNLLYHDVAVEVVPCDSKLVGQLDLGCTENVRFVYQDNVLCCKK